MATIYYVIDNDDASCLVILESASKTSKVKISPLRFIELLIALKNIWSTKSSFMSGILIVIKE